MNLVQLTPGTGGMYCGNCFRDNALVAELRKMGHEALMLPLYLPLTLDEPDQSAGTPIFFGGINVYLEQRIPLFRSAPNWLRKVLASPALLARAAGHSAKTRAEDVGDILISMLDGEEGKQAREIEELIAWLKTQPKPEWICLSNALLLGMVHPLKQQLQTRILCFLQGEDSYLDSLGDAYREPAWKLLRQKVTGVDLFIAPNQYFADVMTRRLTLPPGKVRVVRDGIHLQGYADDGAAKAERQTLHLGYFARMCPEKGLHLLVDAFIQIRQRDRVPNLRLKVGGGCGPSDEPFVAKLQNQLAKAGLADAATFHPNLSREEKITFLQSLDVFSVPATYPEAFGMYLAEALAAGVAVVQPRVASFPEFVETTGGGVLYDPQRQGALAETLEELLLDPARARQLSITGQRAVQEKYSAEAMARALVQVLQG